MLVDPLHARLAHLPREDRDEVIERAAIIEHDGGMSREKAEDAAVRQFYQRCRAAKVAA